MYKYFQNIKSTNFSQYLIAIANASKISNNYIQMFLNYSICIQMYSKYPIFKSFQNIQYTNVLKISNIQMLPKHPMYKCFQNIQYTNVFTISNLQMFSQYPIYKYFQNIQNTNLFKISCIQMFQTIQYIYKCFKILNIYTNVFKITNKRNFSK